MSEELKVGDYVRLVKGKQSQVVLQVKEDHRGAKGQWVRAQYPSSLAYDPEGDTISWRPAHDYVKLIPVKVKEPMAKLYELKDESGKSLFGTLLARNSAGQLVLEIKGTGEVRAVNTSDATEVKPYTVSISIDAGGRPSTSNYQSKPGALTKGDVILFSDGRFGIVKAVDTKADSFQSLKNARKVMTEPLEELGPATDDDEAI